MPSTVARTDVPAVALNGILATGLAAVISPVVSSSVAPSVRSGGAVMAPRPAHDRRRLALVARGLLGHVDDATPVPGSPASASRSLRVLGRIHVLGEERLVLEAGDVRREVLAEPLRDRVGLGAGRGAPVVAAVAMRTDVMVAGASRGRRISCR
jgi:hypothetical protein